MSVIVKGGVGAGVKFDDNYKGTLYIKPDKSTPKNIVSFEASADLPTEVWNIEKTSDSCNHIYVNADNEVYITENHAVYKFNSNGEQISSYTIPETYANNISGMWAFLNGSLLLKLSIQTFLCVSADLSTLLWVLNDSNIASSIYSAMGYDGNFYTTNSSGVYIKITQEGTYETIGGELIDKARISADSKGNIYQSKNKKLYKFNSQGTLIWSVDITFNAIAFIFDDNENIYFAGSTYKTAKASPNGEVSWEFQSVSGSNIMSITMDDEGNIITGDNAGNIQKITPYGALVYSFNESTAFSAAYKNGNLYTRTLTVAKKLSDAGTITHKAVFNY